MIFHHHLKYGPLNPHHHPSQLRTSWLVPSCSKPCFQHNSTFIKNHHLIIITTVVIVITVIMIIIIIMIITIIVSLLLIIIINFQSGVFMSSQKYQGLLDQVNRQKIAIDNEKVGDLVYNATINFIVIIMIIITITAIIIIIGVLVAAPLTVSEIFCATPLSPFN